MYEFHMKAHSKTLFISRCCETNRKEEKGEENKQAAERQEAE